MTGFLFLAIFSLKIARIFIFCTLEYSNFEFCIRCLLKKEKTEVTLRETFFQAKKIILGIKIYYHTADLMSNAVVTFLYQNSKNWLQMYAPPPPSQYTINIYRVYSRSERQWREKIIALLVAKEGGKLRGGTIFTTCHTGTISSQRC